MLVLKRRVGESLVIDDKITITVLGQSANQMKLGIEAPKYISVHRQEVHDIIQEEKGKPNNQH